MHSTQTTPRELRNRWTVVRDVFDPRKIRQHEDKVLFLLTLVIGALVGLIVVAFILVTENLGSRMYPAGGAAWRRLVVPVLGALITGFLLQRYFPNARGSGIPQTKTALFIHGGIIRLRTVLGKFGCSSVSLASGIALGREGPSVQVGAGLASILGRQLGLSPSIIKALVPIGASAALAAAFNTPIAAVLFTLEEVMGDLHARVLGAIVLSSATSWMVLHLLLGDEPLFHVPAYQLVNPLEFGFYAVLGVIGGLVSVCFVKLLLWQRKHFMRLPAWSGWLQPAVGGLLVGIMGWFVPAVLGVGYNHVSQALNGQMALRTMMLLVVLKLIATASCYASGNAGGIFGPSLFLGAMMGGAVGGGAHMVLPDYTGSVGAYALVGMGATFAGIIRVPMTSVIMIFEVTRDYSIIVPLMIANLISYFISSRLQREPIYEGLLHQDGIHLPVGARDREEMLSVHEGVRPAETVLSADDRIDQALASVRPEDAAWPVVESAGLRGMITLGQLQEEVKRGRGSTTIGAILPPIEPEDNPPVDQFVHVHADQPLDTAMRRMAQSGLSVIPVVSRTNLRELTGIISLRDALAAYKSESKGDSGEAPLPEKKSPVALLGGVLAVVLTVIALAAFLSYFYRVQLTTRAQEYYQQGNELMTAQRYPEAIEKYRSALSISHTSRDRLALALALLQAGRSNEAEIYLNELVRQNPNSGPANLGLARIAASQDRIQEAVDRYRQAIIGAWPENPIGHQLQTRIELVRVLGRFNRKAQAQAELISLSAELPDDAGIRREIARMLLEYSLPKQAAEVYRQEIAESPRDADAFVGLGEAQMALDDYRAAETAYDTAARLEPGDAGVKRRLELTRQILGLDPTLRGLTGADRYERSRKLLEATLGLLSNCAATTTRPVSGSVMELLEGARKTLLNRHRPRSYGDAFEANVHSAQELWQAHGQLCGTPREDALGIIMTRLTR